MSALKRIIAWSQRDLFGLNVRKCLKMSNVGKQSRLSILVERIARGDTTKDAAVAAGYSARHVGRLLMKPRVQDRVKMRRLEILDEATSMLLDADRLAVETLKELMGQTSPPAVRLGAAKATIDLSIKLRENLDLALRVEVLERELRAKEADAI